MLPFILFVAFSFLGSSCPSSKGSSLSTDQINKITEISVRDVPDGAPGIACGIVIDGEIVFEKYAGYANLEDSILIDASSRFNIASNAKQYVAILALQLIEEKRLNLEDDFRMYFEDLFPDIKDRITIRNLLTHTSGIRDVYNLWNLKGLTWWKHSFSNKEAIRLLAEQQDLNFIPGSKYLYSNSNYILLAQLIEKVHGKSFLEVSNDFFQSIGMNNTSFEPDHTKIKGPIASPYFNFNNWVGYDWIWNIVGDGNLFSTLKDQMIWEQVIQGYDADSNLRKIIKISQQPVVGSAIKSYGYGLELADYQGYSHAYHHGGTGAWKATVSRFPNEKISIITMSNSGKTDVVGQNRAIADVILDINSDGDLTTVSDAGPDWVPRRVRNMRKDEAKSGTSSGDESSIEESVDEEEPVVSDARHRIARRVDLAPEHARPLFFSSL